MAISEENNSISYLWGDNFSVGIGIVSFGFQMVNPYKFPPTCSQTNPQIENLSPRILIKFVTKKFVYLHKKAN